MKIKKEKKRLSLFKKKKGMKLDELSIKPGRRSWNSQSCCFCMKRKTGCSSEKQNSLRTKACSIWRKVRNLPCSRKDTSQAVPLKEAELDTLVPLGNVQGFVTLLCEMVAVHVHIGIYMILW